MKWKAYRRPDGNYELKLRCGGYSCSYILPFYKIKNPKFIVYAKNELRYMAANLVITR